MEEYKSKIEYINSVLHYIEKAQNGNFKNPLEFIRSCVEYDKSVYSEMIDRLSKLNK